MDDARPHARETPKAVRTRARILDAAMGLFATIGYHRTDNTMIAEAAGLTRAPCSIIFRPANPWWRR